jgi:hypothetical protein
MRTMIATAVLVGSVGLFAQTSTGLDGRLPTVVVPAALTVCDSHEVAQRIARAAGIPLGFEAIPTCNVETHPPRLSRDVDLRTQAGRVERHRGGRPLPRVGRRDDRAAD